MSRDDVPKSLAKWLTKAQTIAAPPGPEERRGTRSTQTAPAHEPVKQFNVKIPESKYRHIKALAHRDRLTNVAMLYEMVDLYEKAHGKL